MQPIDRESFDSHMQILCAGFNVPATAERLEAYWTGLSKMPISAFARCVEHALGESGPEKIPTTSGLWSIFRQTRAVRIDRPTRGTDGVPRDALREFGNRALLMFLAHPKRSTGTSALSLELMIEVKNKLVESYRQVEADALGNGEEPPSSEEILAALHKRFAELYEPNPKQDLEALQEQYHRTGRVTPTALYAAA